MKSEITEISYSMALTYELVTEYHLLTLGAPTFPSLRDEVIYRPEMEVTGRLLFIQYKLGEYIIGTGSSLKEHWGLPYYRFLVHPRKKPGRQNLLESLEEKNHFVFYAAPEFHTMSELYDALVHRTILAKSRFWAPKAVGRFSESGRYTLSYKRGVNYSILEPGDRRIEGVLQGNMLLGQINGSNQFARFDDEEFFQTGDLMLDHYLRVFHNARERKLIDDIRLSRDRIDSRDYLSLISTLLYDCYVYIVPRAEKSSQAVG
jgi:hypothetical protein